MNFHSAALSWEGPLGEEVARGREALQEGILRGIWC